MKWLGIWKIGFRCPHKVDFLRAWWGRDFSGEEVSAAGKERWWGGKRGVVAKGGRVGPREKGDKAVREYGSIFTFAEQMAAQFAEQERRLRELLEGQRSRLEELEFQLGVALQAVEARQKSLGQPLTGEQRGEPPLGTGAAGLEAADTSGEDLPDGSEELRRRYALALEDLRRLEAENQKLREELEKRRSRSNSVAPETAEENWEAFKRRIWERLEEEGQEKGESSEEAHRRERVEIQEVIQRTEAILAAKDQELETLRHLLENQTANLGTMAVGAAAVGQLLDQDEILRQQRETLQRLEAEWREKLRQAEVEISVERAALARQRAELEEKYRQLEQLHQEALASQGEASPGKASGSWRNFFGLTEGRKK